MVRLGVRIPSPLLRVQVRFVQVQLPTSYD